MTLALATTTSALPTYDWTYPAILQNHDWDCAEESIRWCLFAWGRTPDDAWMESSMIANGIISPELGCLDASGEGLAWWVNSQYSEFGYWAETAGGPVGFDQVVEEVRTHEHPVAMGGAAFYHWVGVRGHDPLMDRLLLANPAPGYKGVYQVMTRQQFAALGAFHMVRVTHPEAESGGAPSVGMLPGIDVSSHQGAVDWTAFRAAGGIYAFSKISGGGWYKNPYADANWSGMRSASVTRGGYHYAFEPSGQAMPGPGPEYEAAFFLDTLSPLGIEPGDMLALDIEVQCEDAPRWALRWLEHCEKLIGFPPMLYSGSWYMDPNNFGSVPDLARYALWLAAYQATMPAPPAPWSKVSIWQFTDRAQVPGVVGPCDGDWFNGTLDELKQLGKPASAPTPDDPYAPWRGLVGSGILQMMKDDQVLPAASRSTWLPLGASPADVETCLGQNGINYAWTVSTTNRGFRYPPL